MVAPTTTTQTQIQTQTTITTTPKTSAASIADYEKKRLHKSGMTEENDVDRGQDIYNKNNIGVVKSDIIRRALSPPYTRPGAQMSLQFGGTAYQVPIRTSIRKNMISVPIEEAERTEDYAQIIPFVVLINNTDKKVLIRKFDDALDIHKELANEYSLGLFGHINGGEGVYEALYRIIEDRTGVQSIDISTCIFDGYIYDNPHHIGLVFLARIELESFNMSDEMYHWITFEEAGRYVKENLVDNWSKITYNYVLAHKHLAGTL